MCRVAFQTSPGGPCWCNTRKLSPTASGATFAERREADCIC
ncbi:cysteine-rich CWC family protein [Pseudomonas gessardii]